MKIAFYARVSTSDQKADLQLDQLRSYASAKGHEIVKEYQDVMSGLKNQRPALNEMLADARRGKFQALVVWKIDRLGRSTQHLLTVLSELQSLKIDFVSLQEAIDTSTPAGKMVFTFLSAVAEFERSIIRERVKAGMEAAKRRGKHCGRPKVKIDPSTIWQLRESGMSLRAISSQLGISHQAAANAIKNTSILA